MNKDDRLNRTASFLIKKLNRAIYKYDMISDNDRVAIALSGGKDSLTLLRLLQYRQTAVREAYDIYAIHVIGDARGTDIPQYPQIEQWLQQNDIKYIVRRMHMPENEKLPMTCARCTYNRRITIFQAANDLGCNKIAFGHHLDDMAETVLLNLAHHARCEAMPPTREYFGGRFTIIRPMIFLAEADIIRYSRLSDFPAPPPKCPLSEHTQRHLVKTVIKSLQKDFRYIKQNLVKAALCEPQK